MEHSKDGMSNFSIELKSSESRTNGGRGTEMSSLGSQQVSRTSGVSETGCTQASQQVVSQPTHSSLLHTSNDKGKPGFEMTEPPTNLHPGSRLPHSAFAPGEGAERLSDDVVFEKSKAQEEFYQRSSGGAGQISTESLASSQCPSQRQEYKSFPVQESGCLQQVCHPPQQDATNSSLASYSSVTSDDSEWSVRSFSSIPSFEADSNISGVQPASVPHTAAPVSWQNNPKLVVRSEEYPAEFKEGHFDCVLIYSRDGRDRAMAINFKDLLKKFVILEDGRPPEICILDRNDNLPHIQAQFASSDEAMNRSTYMFLFITEAFVNDAWAEVQKDECLMESISKPEKKWCVVPLHTQKKRDLKFRYPYGLRALKGVDISVILPGKDLATLDVKQLRKDEIDEYFLQNITRMFNHRLNHKIRREKEQEMELEKWKQEEQYRKYKQIIEEGHERKKAHIIQQEKMKRLQNQHVEDLEKTREHAAKMAISELDPQPHPPAPRLFTAQFSKPAPNASDMAAKIAKLRDIGCNVTEAVDIIKELQQIPRPVVYSNNTAAEMAKLEEMGFTFFEAVDVLKEVKQNEQVVQPAGRNVYNIHNYGNMQVGDRGEQHINKPGGADGPVLDDSEDSGTCDVEVVETQSPTPGVSASDQPGYSSQASYLSSGTDSGALCSDLRGPAYQGQGHGKEGLGVDGSMSTAQTLKSSAPVQNTSARHDLESDQTPSSLTAVKVVHREEVVPQS